MLSTEGCRSVGARTNTNVKDGGCATSICGIYKGNEGMIFRMDSTFVKSTKTTLPSKDAVKIIKPTAQPGILFKTTSLVVNSAGKASAMVINTSGGLARTTLETSKKANDLGWNVAKACTRFGFNVSKKGLSAMGLPTYLVDYVGSAALGGLEFGHNASNNYFIGSSELIRIIQQHIGDPFATELVLAVVSILAKEIIETGRKIGYLEIWQYLKGWIQIQNQTSLEWNNEFIYGSVKRMKAQSFSWNLVSFKFKSDDIILFPADPSKLLPILRHFAKFANGCYSERGLELIKGNLPIRKYNNEREFYAAYCGIPEDDVIFLSNVDTRNDVFDSTYVPRYCISVDHSQNTIVLAFRGTLSVRDAIVDLVGDTLNLTIGDDPTEYAFHNGILQVSTRIVQPDHPSGIYKRIDEAMKKYPTYSLTITGHSLGAAVASTVGVLWASPTTCRTRQGVLQPNRPVRVYAFACPSVMSEDLGLKCKNLILTVVIGWDWLARASHAGIQEITDAAVQLMNICKERKLSIDELLIGKNSISQSEKLLIRKKITMEHFNNRIYPPGRIFWIHTTQKNSKKYGLYKVKDRSKVFGQILFAENMLDHHQPFSYDDVLDKIIF